MKINTRLIVLLILIFGSACKNKKTEPSQIKTVKNFPSAMVKFSALPENPVFEGTREETWDKNLREWGISCMMEAPINVVHWIQ